MRPHEEPLRRPETREPSRDSPSTRRRPLSLQLSIEDFFRERLEKGLPVSAMENPMCAEFGIRTFHELADFIENDLPGFSLVSRGCCLPTLRALRLAIRSEPFLMRTRPQASSKEPNTSSR